MTKTILITGATDGIGLETARQLAAQGHDLLLHGRSAEKLSRVTSEISKIATGNLKSFRADFSILTEPKDMAKQIKAEIPQLDILVNNAGILKTAMPITKDGMDIRFVVNTLAPYVLTLGLLPIMDKTGRVINLSSAAQAPVDLAELTGGDILGDFPAYAQSKLAITMWTAHLANISGPDAPLFVSVNPGSYLATKMVTEGFGMAGNDVNQGVDILMRAALSNEFDGRSGEYFDNDSGRFAPMHAAGIGAENQAALVRAMDRLL